VWSPGIYEWICQKLEDLDDWVVWNDIIYKDFDNDFNNWIAEFVIKCIILGIIGGNFGYLTDIIGLEHFNFI